MWPKFQALECRKCWSQVKTWAKQPNVVIVSTPIWGTCWPSLRKAKSVVFYSSWGALICPSRRLIFDQENTNKKVALVTTPVCRARVFDGAVFFAPTLGVGCGGRGCGRRRLEVGHKVEPQGHFLGSAGLVTNSILSCWLFKIKDWCKKVRFQLTHNKGLRQLFLMMSWDFSA